MYVERKENEKHTTNMRERYHKRKHKEGAYDENWRIRITNKGIKIFQKHEEEYMYKRKMKERERKREREKKYQTKSTRSTEHGTERKYGSRRRTRKGSLAASRVRKGRAIYESIRWRRARRARALRWKGKRRLPARSDRKRVGQGSGAGEADGRPFEARER